MRPNNSFKPSRLALGLIQALGRMQRLATTLAIICVLSGCAHELAHWQSEATWKGKCYSDMHADAVTLAAPGAIDCGFASITGGAYAAKKVRECVKASLNAKKPFIAGFQAIGTDSGYCESMATLPNGRWALLDVDYDRTGGVLIGHGPVLDVMECAAATASRASSQPFVHSECHPSSTLRGLLSR
jgi:hypothetical protein